MKNRKRKLTPQEEVEANVFAMELLMPEDIVMREVTGPLDVETEPEINRLAKLFKVSKQVMTLRLIDLGLLGG